MKDTLKKWGNKQLRYSPLFYQKLKTVQRERALDATKIEELRNRRWQKLIHTAYQKSSFYRNLYDQAGINLRQIQTVEDITQLPVITKQDIKANVEQMFIGRSYNRIRSFTSGTSGPPMQVYRDYQSTIQEWAYQWRQRIDFGHHPGKKTLVLRGNLHRDQRESYDPFTNSLCLSSYHLSEANAAWYYEKISQFAPQAIYAYPSSIESLANILRSIGKRISVPLIFTSSETLYQHQRSKIETLFRARLVDWYGNAERSIALEQSLDGWYDELPLYSINEYYDQHIVSTGLTNLSFPLIRYRVDDVVHLDPHNRAKLAGSRRIEAIQGRSDDILLLPDGSRICMIWGAFDRIPHLCRAQVVQKELETFQINLVTDAAYGPDDEKRCYAKNWQNSWDHKRTIHSRTCQKTRLSGQSLASTN